MKCSKCNQEKELAKGRKFCKDCKNAYERNPKRGTPEAKEKTNKKQQEALLIKKNQNESDEKIDKNLKIKCIICNLDKSITLYKKKDINNKIINECLECNSKKCTRCNKIKELVKGRWCRECKNEYEVNRRSNTEIRKKIRENEKERYKKNKEVAIKNEITFNKNEKKVCSICKQEKTLDLYHLAKTKGKIRAECKECASIKRKEYYQKNREKTIKQTTEYQNKKRQNDPIFKLERNLRCRLYHAIRSQNAEKKFKTFDLTGCTFEYLQKHIENQFYDEMSWENYGKSGWEVDHIKPICKFNLLDDDELKKCFHYTNLQPLWEKENRKKSGKYQEITEI